MRDDEGLVGVDGAPASGHPVKPVPAVLHLPVLRAHHVGINVESVDLAAIPVTAVPVPVTTVTGVERGGDGVLVALHGVVLRAPDVVAKIGITVVVAITSVVARHVDEVSSSITVASYIAQVQGVGKMFVHERCLPVHVRVPAIICTVGKVEPGVSIHGKPIVMHLQHEQGDDHTVPLHTPQRT